MFNAKRASANSIVNKVMSNSNGIGQSKSSARAKSGLKGQNGHKVSDKAHSIKEMQNLRSFTKQYITHVKENYDGKVANNINENSLRTFIMEKMQEVSGGTLNTYFSTANKMIDNLNKDNIGNLTKEDVKDIKSDVKEFTNLKSEHTNRAYNDPQAIKDKMRNTPYSLSSNLQYEAGLRASDAINSDKWTLNQDNTLTIHESKGGLDYQTTQLSPETAERVQDAIQNGYRVSYEEYRATFKEVVENTGQNYTGTHGLRYNFAQTRIKELENYGFTKEEADGQTSLNMGHSRLDITNHYTMG
jgi:hypothetical protein